VSLYDGADVFVIPSEFVETDEPDRAVVEVGSAKVFSTNLDFTRVASIDCDFSVLLFTDRADDLLVDISWIQKALKTSKK
jgi:hypothetical protein